jgi:hypothetical protein
MPRKKTAERRRSDRQEEKAKLLIKGVDVNGNPFEEETVILDVSEAGISFHLKTPIRIQSALAVEVTNIQSHRHVRTMRALVVRLQSDNSGVQFVAACFN